VKGKNNASSLNNFILAAWVPIHVPESEIKPVSVQGSESNYELEMKLLVSIVWILAKNENNYNELYEPLYLRVFIVLFYYSSKRINSLVQLKITETN
jgi:hypothetical protein